MRKKNVTLLFAAFLLIGTTGCTLITTGEASWELYGGIRTKQLSDEPAKVEIQFSVVDKIVDSLTSGKVSDEEWETFAKILWWTAQWYFNISG